MNTGLGNIGPLTRAWVDAALTEATGNVDPEHTATWSWRCTATTIELRGNLPAVSDPRHRELMLTGGALLLNLRVLIRGHGVHVAVQTMPDPTQRDLIAIVRPEGPRAITAEDQSMVDALLLAGSGNRLSGAGPVTPSIVTRLRRAAKVEQTWLARLPGGSRDLPEDRAATIEGNNADVGPETARVVIGTVLDGAATQLQAGQGMQRVLLTAATVALPARTVPSALRNPVNRQAVRELMGGGLWPQAMLRLGGRAPAKAPAQVDAAATSGG